jgi:hypothetical protein
MINTAWETRLGFQPAKRMDRNASKMIAISRIVIHKAWARAKLVIRAKGRKMTMEYSGAVILRGGSFSRAAWPYATS